MKPQHALNRAYAHWLKDGLFEVGLGILFTGVGTLRAFIHFAGEKTAAYYWLAAALLVFMLGFGFAFKRIGEALKERISYPRTGYTAFKPRTINRKRILTLLVLLILGGALGAMLGILASQPDQQSTGMLVPICFGIVGAMIFSFIAQRIEVRRFYYLAAISILLGLAIGALGNGVVLGVSFFYLGIGIVLIVTGGVTLVQYLRNHEPVDLNGDSL